MTKSRSDLPRFTPGAAAVLLILVSGGLFSLAAIVWASGRVGL